MSTMQSAMRRGRFESTTALGRFLHARRAAGGVFVLLLAGACSAPRPKPFSTQPRRTDRFAVLGDVRARFPLAFWRPRNDRPRAVLVRTLARMHPAFVIIHGDLVPQGSSGREWAQFDRTFAPLRWAAVPILPALGNHEYLGRDAVALGNYFARFPGLKGHRWYRRDLGPVAILVLDTNKSAMSTARWAQQKRWYLHQVGQIAGNQRVRGFVVVVHHPPFTNSATHGGAGPVRRELLPPFLDAPKGLVFLAGHVHTYERFAVRGKVLVNTGGGGAPRHHVQLGPHRPYKTDVYKGAAVRPFHFIEVRLGDTGLRWIVRGLARGGDRLHVMERFDTPYPTSAPSPGRPVPPKTGE